MTTPSIELWTAGRLSNFAQIPVRIVTMAGIIAKIAVKTFVISPLLPVLNVSVNLINFSKGREIKWYSFGCSKKGFENDLINIEYTAKNLRKSIRDVFTAPSESDYIRRTFFGSILEGLTCIFTERQFFKAVKDADRSYRVEKKWNDAFF